MLRGEVGSGVGEGFGWITSDPFLFTALVELESGEEAEGDSTVFCREGCRTSWSDVDVMVYRGSLQVGELYASKVAMFYTLRAKRKVFDSDTLLLRT